MALPSQTRREKYKKPPRSRRPAKLSRTFRLLLAAGFGTAVILVALRMFAWPEGGAAGGTQSVEAAAEPAIPEQAQRRQSPLASSAPVAPPLPPPGARAEQASDRPVDNAAASPAPPETALARKAPAPVESTSLEGAAIPVAALPLAAPMTLPDSPSARQVQEAVSFMEANRPIEARLALTALLQVELSPADEELVRDALVALNRRLVFSPEVVAGDPFSRAYTVGRGDVLTTIVKAQKLLVDWRFILRVNGIGDEKHLREGQRLKLVNGPFDAVVDKSDFRMDLYMGRGADRVYVVSFPVGLGELNGTPVGRFRVRPGSRTANPAWANPRTGEQFKPTDPANPIGEHWIGLEGLDEGNRQMNGYGIHGTIDPASIGHQKSMGCVRMLPDDVALVYEVLTDDSLVEIRP